MKTLIVVVFFAACAFAQDQAAIAKAKAACGPDEVEFDVRTDKAGQPAVVAEAGKALVYIIEEEVGSCGFNCAATTKVGLDGSWIGANQGNSYFYFAVDPGEHHLCARWQSKLSLRRRLVALGNFTTEAGKIYYFRTRIIELSGGPLLDLDPVNSDLGQFLVASFPVSIAREKK